MTAITTQAGHLTAEWDCKVADVTERVGDLKFCKCLEFSFLSRRQSKSIPWCISFRLILSLPTWRHHLFHALAMKPWRAFTLISMNYRLNCVASAFKSTDLIYTHWVSKENFAVTVKAFSYVSLVCREVHISYVESICKWRRSLITVVVANLPVDELFAGVRSPELIWISSSCDITVSSQDSTFVSGLLTKIIVWM